MASSRRGPHRGGPNNAIRSLEWESKLLTERLLSELSLAVTIATVLLRQLEEAQFTDDDPPSHNINDAGAAGP